MVAAGKLQAGLNWQLTGPYDEHGIYRYANGVNPRAILALTAGVLGGAGGIDGAGAAFPA
jgi:cytosine/uracil/thiamine/allantoin permease